MEALRDSLTPIPANLWDGGLQLRQTLFSFKIGRALRAAHLGSEYGGEELRRGASHVKSTPHFR